VGSSSGGSYIAIPAPVSANLRATREAIGAHGSAPRLVEIARAASELGGARGRVAAWPLDEARKVLWGFADAIASDQIISGEKAKRELGWNPWRASIIDELRAYALAVA
jgi:hypothetical protein